MKTFSLVVFATVAGSSLQGAGVPVDPPVAPTPSVMWGGLAFDEPAALSPWLRERGSSYGQWAANHPRAASRLEIGLYGIAPPLATPAPSQRPPPAPAEAAPATRDRWTGSGASLLTAGLAAIAATLLVLALLPILHLRRVRVPGTLENHQPELAGAGVAVAVALAAALLL